MRRINIKVVPRDERSFVADQDWYVVRPSAGSDGEDSDSGDQRQWRSAQDPGNVEVAVNGNVWTFGGDMQPIVSTTIIAATTRLLNLNGSALMVRLSSDFFLAPISWLNGRTSQSRQQVTTSVPGQWWPWSSKGCGAWSYLDIYLDNLVKVCGIETLTVQLLPLP